jgi:hypothetical protein
MCANVIAPFFSIKLRNAARQGKFCPQESSWGSALAASQERALGDLVGFAAFKIPAPADCYPRLILGMD